jgi:hypothetical protein
MPVNNLVICPANLKVNSSCSNDQSFSFPEKTVSGAVSLLGHSSEFSSLVSGFTFSHSFGFTPTTLGNY